ncbi:putative glycolipid-binding domain-containing protein [Chitinophaga sp. Cy-1792]|uniref:putative glycolipid-binding domain-containing protein n=1 Tax=Chitinophaga sp. Cy-1792 TaxID=2608339 RepID=UPI001423FB24|nr:putative glycolipid-binding domain-containing protein [Chitinophaga sp. Cy-1792]NIG56158.1 putative glycolipid-binding domain-containing protein [Chitinophaga sp. Cy-1792]
MKLAVWQALRWTATEYFTLEDKGIFQLAHGHIAGVIRDLPFSISYEIEITNDWRIEAFTIRAEGTDKRELKLQSNLQGEWYDREGNQISAFNGCLDIDISLTPFTNSLPIKRLSHLKIGDSEVISVIYILLPEFELHKMQQRYTRMNEDSWLYENLESGFTAQLYFDEDGIMNDYPGYLQRRY